MAFVDEPEAANFAPRDFNWVMVTQRRRCNSDYVFPALTRAQLINDAFSLFDAGVLNLSIPLRTLNFLRNETDYVPWRAFARRSYFIDKILERSEMYGAFKEFMKDTTQKTYGTWGFDVTTDTENINIYQINRGASYACKYGLQKCADDALQLYREWMMDGMANSSKMNQNIQRTVICNGIRYGGVKEWNFAFDTCRKTGTDQLKVDCFDGLSCTKEPWLLEKMLNLAFDNSSFEEGEVVNLIQNINVNAQGRELAWNFVKTNFKELENYIGSKRLSNIIRGMSGEFTSQYFLSELENFATLNMTSEYEDALQRAIRNVEDNLAWLNENSGIVKDWLVERGYGDYVF